MSRRQGSHRGAVGAEKTEGMEFRAVSTVRKSMGTWKGVGVSSMPPSDHRVAVGDYLFASKLNPAMRAIQLVPLLGILDESRRIQAILKGKRRRKHADALARDVKIKRGAPNARPESGVVCTKR